MSPRNAIHLWIAKDPIQISITQAFAVVNGERPGTAWSEVLRIWKPKLGCISVVSSCPFGWTQSERAKWRRGGHLSCKHQSFIDLRQATCPPL